MYTYTYTKHYANVNHFKGILLKKSNVRQYKKNPLFNNFLAPIKMTSKLCRNIQDFMSTYRILV
jgi:hypothetical protein